MPASWGDLFDRGADYGVDLETVRTAADRVSTTETEETGTEASSKTAETRGGDDA